MPFTGLHSVLPISLAALVSAIPTTAFAQELKISPEETRNYIVSTLSSPTLITTSYYNRPGRWVVCQTAQAMSDCVCDLTIEAKPSQFSLGVKAGEKVRPVSPEQMAQFAQVAIAAAEPLPPIAIRWNKVARSRKTAVQNQLESSYQTQTWASLFGEGRTLTFGLQGRRWSLFAMYADLFNAHCSQKDLQF
ncbi:hypothetical protein [Novosphingobium aquae]|jgi:hypothetical protein|uniref:Uncharacterized protein n=1 Tax=Novosphingobium aquae TaxID=3133435 RepID=A0ABU8S4G9_9SPHN